MRKNDRRRPLFVAAVVGGLAMSAVVAGRQSVSLAITNVAVIDGTGAEPMPGMTIVIEGSRISDIFRTGSKPLSADADVRDLRGHTIIPGLIDAHVHLRQLSAPERMEAELRRMLRAGIVAVREMAGGQITAGIRGRVRRGELEGPDVYSSIVIAGPAFMANDPRVARGGGAGRGGLVASAEDVSVAIARASESDVSVIKLYAELTPAVMALLSKAARERGLKVWSHATIFPARPIDTIRAGVDGISHACDFAWQDPDLDPSLYTQVNANARPRFNPALVDANGPSMTAVFAEMAAHGIVFDPTLAVHARPGDDVYGCTTEVTVALARAAKRAGVTLLAGTDFFSAESSPYPSLYEEIERLVTSGVLTPLQAIAAATLNPARAMGIHNMLGTIQAGKDASLVVLKSDPSRDITGIRDVVTVFKRGSVVSRR
jgi:imidazolonepropionase-like amidohydrolase